MSSQTRVGLLVVALVAVLAAGLWIVGDQGAADGDEPRMGVMLHDVALLATPLPPKTVEADQRLPSVRPPPFTGTWVRQDDPVVGDAPRAARLIGHVSHRWDGSPLDDVTVSVTLADADSLSGRDWDTRTDKVGRFLIDFPETVHVLAVHVTAHITDDASTGARTLEEDVVIPWGAQHEVWLDVPDGGQLAGHVVDGAGHAVGDATVLGWVAHRSQVTRRGADLPPTMSVATDAAGRFVLPGLGPDFVLGVEAPGRVCGGLLYGQRQQAEAIDGLQLVLHQAHPLDGSITASDGRPVPGVAIEARPLALPFGGEFTDVEGVSRIGVAPSVALTDEEGRFHFNGLAGRSTRFAVASPDYKSFSTQHDPRDGPLHIRLSQGASLSGLVLGPAGAPGHAVMVVQPVEVLEEETRFVELTLEPAFALAGQLVDVTGAPVSGARVSIEGDRLVGHGDPLIEPRPTWERAIDVRLKPERALRLRLVDEAGRPHKHVTVRFTDEFGNRLVVSGGQTGGFGILPSDAQGEVRARGLPAGLVTVTSRPRFSTSGDELPLFETEDELSVSFDLSAELAGVQTIVMPRPAVSLAVATVIAQVRNLSGPHAQGAVARILDADGIELTAVNVDRLGNIRLVMPRGVGRDVRLVLEAGGMQRRSFPLTVVPARDLILGTLDLLPLATIEGTVHDEDGEGVSGVSVSMLHPFAKHLWRARDLQEAGGMVLSRGATGADGGFSLRVPEICFGYLRFEHPSYAASTVAVEEEAGTVLTEVEISLRAGLELRGTLSTPAGQIPEGAEVRLVEFLGDGGFLKSEQAPDSVTGEFEFTRLAAGEYRLIARAPGYEQESFLGVAGGDSVQVSLLPKGTGDLVVTALGAGGSRLDRFDVWLHWYHGPSAVPEGAAAKLQPWTRFSFGPGADGHATLKNLPAARYRIWAGVDASGLAKATKTWVRKGQVGSAGILTLGPVRELRGLVLDEDTQLPVIGAEVSVRAEDYFGQTYPGSPFVTDNDGRFHGTLIGPESLVLSVSAEGYLEGKLEVAASREAGSVTVTLEPERTMLIRIPPAYRDTHAGLFHIQLRDLSGSTRDSAICREFALLPGLASGDYIVDVRRLTSTYVEAVLGVTGGKSNQDDLLGEVAEARIPGDVQQIRIEPAPLTVVDFKPESIR